MIARRPSRHELQRRLDEVGPYIGIAREIGAAAAGLASQDRADPEKLRQSLTSVIAKMTARERQNFIVETFDDLPPSDQMSLLLRVFDDNTLRIALEAKRVEAGKRAITQLAEVAEETGGLDLTLVPFRSSVEVTLFERNTYYESKDLDYLNDSDATTRILTLGHLGLGMFHVLDDRARAEDLDVVTFYPEIDEQQVIGLGCLLDAGMSSERLEPVLYLGTAMNSTLDAGRQFSIEHPVNGVEVLVVGHIDVNGQHILG